MSNTYSIRSNGNIVKIYINNLLHFTINKDDVVSLQSWVEHKPFWTVVGGFIYSLIIEHKIDVWVKSYKIEFTLKNGEMTHMEYDDVDKWKSILQLIDKEI